MKGVTFGNYHSYDDFSLILSQKKIGAPLPKREVIDIPGGDGVLDLTDFFGDVNYSNRQLTFDFSARPSQGMIRLVSEIQNAIQAQKMRVVLDDDPGWYYTGRVEVSSWKEERGIGTVTIDCDCEPYKTKVAETVITQTVGGAVTVVLTNSRKPVIPTLDVSGEISLTFGENFYTLSSGRYDLPAVVLKHGSNTVLLDGTGTATFTYRERGL